MLVNIEEIVKNGNVKIEIEDREIIIYKLQNDEYQVFDAQNKNPENGELDYDVIYKKDEIDGFIDNLKLDLMYSKIYKITRI